MQRNILPLLTRLRRHRGLWVLAMAVLMIKLVAGTVCLTDGPRTGVAVQTTMAVDPTVVVDPASAADNADACSLGEAGDCHCACAHTMPMPATAVLSIGKVASHFESPTIYSSVAPALTGSLLRPPIA